MAKKEKKSFIVYQSWEDAFNLLTEKEKSQFITNLFLFHRGEDIILDTPMLSMFWKSIEFNLKRNVDEYDMRSITSAENGSKGGAPKGNKNASKQPKQPNQPIDTLGSTYSTKNNPNDNDNDNVNMNDNVNSNINENLNVNDKAITYTIAKKLLADLCDWSLSFSMFEEALEEMNSIGFSKLCMIAQLPETEIAKIKECVNIRVEQQN